jgi:putative endonuclease
MIPWWWRRLLRSGGGLGGAGERRAARWLRQHGYRILERNLRRGHDEADLLALDPDGRTVVLVEVKTQRGRGPAPEERIDWGKARRLRRLAVALQARGPYAGRSFRIDAVAVTWPEGEPPSVRHYVNAVEG